MCSISSTHDMFNMEGNLVYMTPMCFDDDEKLCFASHHLGTEKTAAVILESASSSDTDVGFIL